MQAAIDALLRIQADPNAKQSDVIAASKLILAYGLGQPVQPVVGSDDPADAPLIVKHVFV